MQNVICNIRKYIFLKIYSLNIINILLYPKKTISLLDKWCSIVIEIDEL